MAKLYLYEDTHKSINSSYPLDLYDIILERAKRHDRSLSREVVAIVRKALEQEQQRPAWSAEDREHK